MHAVQKNIGIAVLFLLAVFASCSDTPSRAPSTVDIIYSIKEAKKELDRADQHTLVLFDVDDTLTYNINVPFQPWFFKTKIGKKFHTEVGKHFQSKDDSRMYRKRFRAHRMRTFTDQPLEPEIIHEIKKLQNRGVPVIALTRMNTGSLGRTLIPSLPKWRYEKLQKVGIDFSSSFKQQEVVLTKLVSYADRHPVFYKGILLTDMFPKGKVLGEFLDVMKLKPKKVIFFDDRIRFIRSVEKEMYKRNIAFSGYAYRAIDELPQTFDQKILDYQLKHLKEHDEFISDEKAREAVYK